MFPQVDDPPGPCSLRSMFPQVDHPPGLCSLKSTWPMIPMSMFPHVYVPAGLFSPRAIIIPSDLSNPNPSDGVVVRNVYLRGHRPG